MAYKDDEVGNTATEALEIPPAGGTLVLFDSKVPM